MKQTDKLFKEIIRISGDSYLDKYMYESGAAILEIYIDEIDKKISIEVESNLMFFNVPKANDIVNRTCYIELEYLPNHLNNVSSTNSKQSKLCVKCTLYIDTRLLGKHGTVQNFV